MAVALSCNFTLTDQYQIFDPRLALLHLLRYARFPHTVCASDTPKQRSRLMLLIAEYISVNRI